MTEKILLVDDEPEILDILTDFLEDEDFTVISAKDGVEALELFNHHDLDLVITDVRMPNKNGIELLKDIGESPKDVDVIILTGQSDEMTAIDCLRAGAYDYLLKPVEDLDILLSSITRALQKRRLEKENKILVNKLEELAIRDPLTGLYNMRPFYSFIDSEIEESLKSQKEFGLLIVDIDHFKSVNDTFGHPFGDFVLQEFASILKNGLPESNKFFRYGGEEFVILLPDTGREVMECTASRILEAMRAHQFVDGENSTNITVSIGGAIYPSHTTEKIKLVKMADQALYDAKQSGRDKFIIA